MTFFDFTTNMLVIQTQSWIYIINVEGKFKMRVENQWNDLIIVLLIPQSTTRDYYLYGGLEKGAVIAFNIEWSTGSIMYDKTHNVHRTLMDMRYEKDKRLIFTVGEEGVMKIIAPFEGEGFEVKMTLNFAANQISRNLFITNTEIIAGLDAGNLQYVEYDLKEFT